MTDKSVAYLRGRVEWLALRAGDLRLALEDKSAHDYAKAQLDAAWAEYDAAVVQSVFVGVDPGSKDGDYTATFKLDNRPYGHNAERQGG
jgi:hypothetical protein